MARLSLASLPLNTESFVVFGFGNVFACQPDWQKLEVCVKGVIHVNYTFLCLKKREKTFRRAEKQLAEKDFGMPIYKQKL